MPRHARPEPLYRKVNTRARGVRHGTGGDYRHVRGSSGEASGRGTMHAGARRGRDYTPLFRFLLARVGEPWDAVFGEAAARLDTTEPVFWIVARSAIERQETVRVGESTYVSGLFVDDDSILRRVAPGLRPEHLTPSCTCCTHTLDGVRFG